MTLRLTLATSLALTFAVGCGDKEDTTDTGATGTDGSALADADGDGFDTSEDCDDTNADINPGAEEVCDGLDNDCNGEADDGVLDAFYADADGDGYGGMTMIEACEAPSGFVDNGDDCNDLDAAVNPGATEVCDADAVDEDCSGAADDADENVDPASQMSWYPDADTDGYGDVDGTATLSCAPISGQVADNTDCDDGNADVNPGATEICDEADVDEDCSGDADDADPNVDPASLMSFYTDGDTDGYGDEDATAVVACEMPSGTAMDNTDCDDGNIDVNPGAAEVCDDDNVDEDCSGAADDADVNVTGQTIWNVDYDGDEYGSAAIAQTACDQPTGFVADDTDCNDTDGAINPGATEVCDDDDVDEDCSGAADDNDTGVDTSTYSTFYVDGDGDGYGDSSMSTTACDAGSGYSADMTDCDDDDSGVNPGADEVCDYMDNNCDGNADEGATIDFYPDNDGDSFGDSNLAYADCEPPLGYTMYGGDCDDEDEDIFPYAYEDMSDTIDNDCDGFVDADDEDLLTELSLGDDDSESYFASGAWSFPLCGSDWSSFYVHSNGQVTFDFSHTDWSESSSDFLSDGVAIGLPWDDYSPNNGGNVYVTEHGDAVAVHFRDVPDYSWPSGVGENTFSIVMHESGMMHFSNYENYSGDALVGWSCGDDSTVSSSDLSSEYASLPDGAFGLSGMGARAHYEYFSAGFDLEGAKWMMCGTGGNDADGDGWSDICGDMADYDASIYPGAPVDDGCDSGDSGCVDSGN